MTRIVRRNRPTEATDGGDDSPPRRYTAEFPCPGCGGWEKQPRGRSIRCDGYISGYTPDVFFCRRIESPEEKEGGLYKHKRRGKCSCEGAHAEKPRKKVVRKAGARVRRKVKRKVQRRAVKRSKPDTSGS